MARGQITFFLPRVRHPFLWLALRRAGSGDVPRLKALGRWRKGHAFLRLFWLFLLVMKSARERGLALRLKYTLLAERKPNRMNEDQTHLLEILEEIDVSSLT